MIEDVPACAVLGYSPKSNGILTIRSKLLQLCILLNILHMPIINHYLMIHIVRHQTVNARIRHVTSDVDELAALVVPVFLL